MIMLLKLAALGGLVLLGLSIYPGVLADVFFIVAIFFPLWIPALGIVLLILMLMQTAASGRKAVKTELEMIDDDIVGGKKPVLHRRWGILSPAILVLSLTLILNGIPRRIAFVLSRPAFQRHTAMAPPSGSEDEALGRWLGVYYVDRFAADPLAEFTSALMRVRTESDQTR